MDRWRGVDQRRHGPVPRDLVRRPAVVLGFVGDLAAARRLGLTGALLMAVGSLGAGALPVPNPLFGVRVLGLPARNDTLAIALTYAGMGLLVLAWVRVALMPRDPHTRPGSGLVRTAVTWAAPLALAPPLFSRDVYSYLAQGALLSRGLNPSVVSPAAGLGVDDPLVRSIPTLWRDTPSPYGPLFLMLAHGVSRLSGDDVVLGVLAHRAVALAGLAAVAWALPRLARRFGVAADRALWLGAANPLMLFHVVSGAHNDALMLGLLLVGVEIGLRAGNRLLDPHLLAGAAVVVCASAVKLPALLALGFLGIAWAQGRGGRLPDVAKVAVVLLAVTVVVDTVLSDIAGVGWAWLGALYVPGLALSWMSPMTDLGLLAGGFGVLAGLGDHTASVLGVSQLVGGAAAAVICIRLLLAALRGRLDPLAGLAAGTAAVVVLGPSLQPWYLLWAVVPMAATAALPRFRRTALAASAVLAVVTVPSGSDFGFHVYQLPTAVVAAAAVFGVVLLAEGRALRPRHSEQFGR